MTSTAGYGTYPELGSPVWSMVDPTGSALTTATDREAPGAGFLPRTKRRPLAGVGSEIAAAYCGAAQGPIGAVCGGSCTDVWGKATSTSYDQAGRVTQATNPGGTVGYGYTADGLVDTVSLNGGVLADPMYNGWGRMTGVLYPSGGTNKGNATSGSFTIDPVWFRRTVSRGRVRAARSRRTRTRAVWTGMWLTRRSMGLTRILAASFEYDNAGRLVGARVLERTAGGVGLRSVCYDFQATTGTCGVSPNSSGGVVAGRNSNRVRTTATSVSYGRDASDRVVERKVGSSTVARYSYSAGGDTADLTLNGSSTVVEATLSLPGGVGEFKGEFKS
ncbi:MAG: hypothetical protein V9E99_08020 [Microthrixaceae bacterium]